MLPSPPVSSSTFRRLIRVFLVCVLGITASKLNAQPPGGADHPDLPYETPYPHAESIKGLQVESVPDALELGIKHAAVNLDLARLIRPDAGEGTQAWESQGHPYHFDTRYLQSLDNQVSELSRHGVLVNVILLAYLASDDRINEILIHPECVDDPPNRLGAFNVVTDEGRAWIRASLEFLAERWSRPDQSHGRVVGWIVGNEVNSHWWWSNRGHVRMEPFAEEYERLVRLVHESVRTASISDRVYLSLEHHWKMRYPPAEPTQAFAGKPFVERFAELARRGGDFDWHIAFHPYPEDLFDPAFWEDETATDSDDTPRITPRNLEVLVRFVKRPELRFQGDPRRIILSEQGFHSPPDEAGQRLQAAAYCYAYRLILQFPEIDAFILHRHIDHPREGGLNLGLRERAHGSGSFEQSYPRKPIYRCFQLADTDRWRSAFEFALPIVGVESWPGPPGQSE